MQKKQGSKNKQNLTARQAQHPRCQDQGCEKYKIILMLSQTDNLRWCERIKKTEVYLHVEGLAKKIRKKKTWSKPINANSQQREIDVFYKVGWEYEHAHYNMTCDISQPLFIQPSEPESLQEYYQKVSQLIFRFKTEHEDESGCKVEVRDCLTIPKMAEKYPYNLVCAKGIYKSCLNAMESIVTNMHHNMLQLEEKEINESNAGGYWHVKEMYEYMVEWIQDYTTQIHDFPDPELVSIDRAHVAHQTLQFMSNFAQTVSSMRTDKRSALFNFQPNTKMLSYLVHPILLGIYTSYHKQKIVWENEYEHNINNIKFEERVEKDNTLPEDIEHFQIPRVAFINLDGYESEYNIEFARNMDKHLMYVSFPIFENKAEEEHLTVNNRFFKKIFYKYTKDLYQYNPDAFDYIVVEDALNQYRKEEQMQDCEADIKEEFEIKFNPEKYFECAEKMFKNKEKSEKNLYILPITFKYLQKEMLTLFKKEQDAQKYASYFIWFLIRDFVGDDIKRFNPAYIAVSYSGRINIIDEHFVRIMQELCIASSRKVLFFPNFTSEIAEEIAINYSFDNFPPSQTNLSNPSMNMFRKMCQFLKISSGTYNLEVPFEKQPILSRYKTAKINIYILGLLNALSESEYKHLAGRVSDIIMRSSDIILTRSINQTFKELESSVPRYYIQIFNIIQNLLITPNFGKNFTPEIMELAEKIQENLQYIAESQGKDSTMYLISEIIQNFYLEISSQKTSDEVYLYLKTRDDKDEWMDIKESVESSKQIHIKDELMNTSKQYNNNLNGFYCLSLKQSSKEKRTLSISPSTEILYKVDQRHKMRGPGKKYANVMVMNNLDKESMNFVSYSGSVTINEDRGNKASLQRIEMFPITFVGMPNINKHAIRTNWNYAQTRNYYLLYWPLEWNLLQANLRSIEELPYDPNILPEIYLARVGNAKGLTFNIVNWDMNSVLPRKFVSSYEMVDEDKVFIFGGFYEKENNYLKLQTDITGLDFTHYNDQQAKCIVSNEKGTMYSMVNTPSKDRKTNNSYMRARRDLEFLELTQLSNDLTEEELGRQSEFRTVYIVGGYGEDFVRPFSLMNCHYYEMTIHVPTRSIQSIKQRTVYERVFTSNIRGFIKNKGSFKKFALYENGILKPNISIDSEHHIAHRSVFKILRAPKDFQQKQQMDEYIETPKFELTNKTKYFFALKIFSQFKKQYHKLAYKIGESIGEKSNDTEEFMLSLSAQGNHYLTVQKDKNISYMIQIFLEVEVEEGNNESRKYQRVSLPHGSIISIDIKNKVIYAIIYHEFYTKGHYILAECSLKSEQSEVLLKSIHRFTSNMSQYSLFIPKIGEILLLHGITFENAQISDILIKHRRDSENIIRTSFLKHPNFITHKAYSSFAHTYFLKDENRENRNLEIESLTFIIPRKKNNSHITCIANRLKISFEAKENFFWLPEWSVDFIFEDSSTKNSILVAEVNEIRTAVKEPFARGVDSTAFSYSYPSETVSIEKKQTKPNQNQQCLPSTTIPPNLLIRVTGHNKKSYLGHLQPIQDHEKDNSWKFLVYDYEVNNLLKVWEKAIPLQAHVKSLARYRDMEVEIPDL